MRSAVPLGEWRMGFAALAFAAFLVFTARETNGQDAVADLEAISARAVELGVLTCKGVASLLARKFDASGADSSPVTLIDHVNVRGPRYYN